MMMAEKDGMGRIGTDEPLYVTTSWDDGHPSDLRLADLLHKHGAHGTFYVPNRNSEGRPVLSSAEIRHVSERFEIGGHTMDHVVLTGLPPGQTRAQILNNKESIEDITGRELRIFAYVRGRYDQNVIELVKAAGFRFARTVKNFSSHPGIDPFRIPTTTQFFAHTIATSFRNYLSGGTTLQRAAVLSRVINSSNLTDRCAGAADACARLGGHFHLWGHSWELDEHDLWGELDRLLTSLRQRNVCFLSNSDWYAARLCQTPAQRSRNSGSGQTPAAPSSHYARQFDQADGFDV